MATLSAALAIALEQHRAGRLDLAQEIWRRILAVEPQQAEALHLLGLIAFQQGQHATAVDCFERAIAINPAAAVCHNQLGLAFKELGRFGAAAACFRRVLELVPGSAEALANLGGALEAQGHFSEALACFSQALAINPDLVEVDTNIGIVFHRQGRLDEAVDAYRRTLRRKPDSFQTLSYLGVALAELGRIDEALAAHAKAVELRPERAEGFLNLARALKTSGRLDEALAACRRAIELRPDWAAAQSNLLYTLHFCPGFDAHTIYLEHRRWNQQHAAPLRQSIRPHPNDRSPERRLRVGYVSPDFCFHPIGRFLLPLLEAHDHRAVEVFCYSSVAAPDEITQGCRAAADAWREALPLADAELADAVREDRIDVLVDLTMHMAHNRMLTFARKPAPVQVTYLAYCGTTGLDAIDYRLTDPYLDPPGGDQRCYSEKSIRLPESYWCYQPPKSAVAVNRLPALASGQVTFGCLNNFCKVSGPTLAAWANLLRAVPGSRLLLHASPGAHRDRVLEFVTQHGVAPERVEFAGFAPFAEYLAFYERIDVALDPFPYGGGTTTCDALWMGVPVVSLVGETAVGRGGLSILSNIGLAELAARDVDDYIRIAAELAGDLERLSRLRATLRQRIEGSPLADASRFARNVEAAYRGMWRQWCRQP